MKMLLVGSTAALTFAMTLALPVTAGAASDGVRHVAHMHRVAHARMIPPGAEALSPPVTIFHEPDPDGLSRDTNACNLGCIDNN